MRLNIKFLFLPLLIAFTAPVFSKNFDDKKKEKANSAPRILNIVNFIRQSEPRDEAITETVLLETTHLEMQLLAKYKLPGTWLIQYDALINPRYQKMLKEEIGADSEVGAWWEITQPHVEAAGLKWRGRYSWDWHANVGFATGYSPEEREKLVDVYMAKFKSIFGKYPTAVGSWFIDSHSLAYMYDKYHIVASSNCKDQIGTDGYTLWGGYWNQAYYPSRLNAYMPAQTTAGQIGVPIFRMLGSDSIYQYDSGLGDGSSGVESLEPVYPRSGANRKWVEWFLKSMAEEPCLSFGYTQAGQENSFTWANIKKAFEMQIPIIDSLKNAGKINVETLSESGRWFKNKFPLTPATAVTSLADYREEGNKTVWYDSRFYRANLLWQGEKFRFRDIHLFDEKFESTYLRKAGTSTQCIYKTLPILDGYSWSTKTNLAGLRIVKIGADGKAVEIPCGNPVVTEKAANVLQVVCTAPSGEKFQIVFYEDRFEVDCDTKNKNFKWALEFKSAPGIELPFKMISANLIQATSNNNFAYSIVAKTGSFKKGASSDSYVFRIQPINNQLVINCNNKER
ncbi:hypothetical protein ACFP1I_28140 [Dyadobacter subterraneus]|uniref:hypothetical protein n=1 Tax=Dyadobacter subterraneus TaxID=2773304 RepID=UPI001D1637CF|nr:hypothetical protein [Dyadobacter subterraneus]